MADWLEDLLRGCTVRVTGGPSPGAGFFVAPGKVLSCVHVIGDSAALVVRWEGDGRAELEARVSGRVAVLDDRGRPIPALDWDYPDIAVLQIGGFDGHPCVRIDPEWPSLEDRFLVYGYPEEGGAVRLTAAQLTYRGTQGTLPTAYLDLASDTIKPGMSGAAVLNLRSGAVCGVVVASKHAARPDGALAIPWSAIDTELADVRAANRDFHAMDKRWEEAAVARRERLSFRLPRVAAYFTGRDDLLAQLHTVLNQRRAGVITQTISGLGGVGKTQLAAAYVVAHRHEFDIAAWVRADDGGTADLADLAVALGLPVAGRTPPERAGDVLMFLANTDRRWLLVLDNVHGPQALAKLPSSGRGRVLVTSRHRGGYDAFGQELAVGVFDADTARRYLLARSGRTGQETSDADAVAATLGYLPLALAHAGAYCASKTGVPFGEYLELLEGLPSQELFDTNPEVFYQHTIAATWNTSITAAGQRAPLAATALEMTACLAPEAIPRSFFAVLEENSAAGRKRVTDALTALHRYCLATVGSNRVIVHRLLQKVIRDRLIGDDQASAVTHALTAIQRAIPEDPKLPATWPQWQELAPHVIALASIEAVANLNAAQLVGILNPTCLFLLSAGSPLPALDLATRAVSLSTGHLGAKHPYTLTARGNEAFSAGSAGRHAAARDQFAALLPDVEQVLGPEHPDTLAARADLAHWTGKAGDAAGARDKFAALLPVRKRVLGPEHRDTLITRASVAGWTGEAGDAAGARDKFAALLPVYEPVLGPEDPETLAARASLARWIGQAGDAAGARGKFAALLPVYERVLIPEHPETLTARANLAHWTGEAGDAAAARGKFAALLPVYERILGPEHPDTLRARANLARWTGQAGDPARARDQYAALLPVYEQLPGPEHLDTLITRASVAGWTGEAGDAARARDQYAALLPDMERVLGPGHPETLTARTSLARWTGQVGDPAGTRDQYAALLSVRERVFGPGHPETLTARASVAGWTGDAGDAAAARDQFAALLPDIERVFGPGHPETLTARASLARWTGKAGDAAAARDQFAALLPVRERVSGPEHPDTLRARASLAHWTGQAGDPTAARDQFAALLPVYELVLGPEHPETLTARTSLARWTGG